MITFIARTLPRLSQLKEEAQFRMNEKSKLWKTNGTLSRLSPISSGAPIECSIHCLTAVENQEHIGPNREAKAKMRVFEINTYIMQGPIFSPFLAVYLADSIKGNILKLQQFVFFTRFADCGKKLDGLSSIHKEREKKILVMARELLRRVSIEQTMRAASARIILYTPPATQTHIVNRSFGSTIAVFFF